MVMKMAGMIINFITQLAYVVMFGSIIGLGVYAAYLLYERKKRNDELKLMINQKPFIARALLKMKDLGRKVRER